MGKQLLQSSLLFQSVIAECDRALQMLHDGPSWNIAEELVKPKGESQLTKASFSQPMCTALQIGLVEIWKSWGITPAAVVGHSSGEVAAAYASGFLSLRDAIVVAYYRGLYLGENAPIKQEGPKGAMCAVGLGEAECAPLLKKYKGRVALAAVNSPSSSTLSGDADAIQNVVAECAENGTFCRALRVDMGKLRGWVHRCYCPVVPSANCSLFDQPITLIICFHWLQPTKKPWLRQVSARAAILQQDARCSRR